MSIRHAAGVDTWSFSFHRESDYAEYEWLAVERRTAELGAKAAATLWCVRRGVPAPNAAAAATSERSERKREAVRWAVGAEVCGAVGCGRSDGLLSVATGDGRRVLCPEHARRWAQ